MIEPTLNYVTCPGAALQGGETHRMGYWEWNQTGDPVNPHVIFCVHGLTRQGRDFDVLARSLSRYARVICPDVVGRGYSDWLAEPMHYAVPQYVSDMHALLAHLQQAAPIEVLDWIGTSMGGLIGMAITGNPQLAMPVAVRKLILNDVGPELEWEALQRIAAYVGKQTHFASVEHAADALRVISAGFGPHSEQEWLALTLPMLRPSDKEGFQLHYDPAIAKPMQGMTLEQVQRSGQLLWNVYDAIKAQTLLIRGAQSDLITTQTAQQMQMRGPCAQWIELQGVGHAPTFVANEQVAIVLNFLLGVE